MRGAASAVITTAALALLLASCDTGAPTTAASGSSSASGSANSQQIAYARCVRSHGVPDFPDPSSSGGFSKTTLQQLAASSSEYQSATQACAHLLPAGGLSQAQLQQWWNGMASFARCMRSHDVPNWPDPTPYPPEPERPTFQLPASIQPTQPIISRMDECLRLVPNNQVVGHIDNTSWQSAQQAMAGS